jgi:hypothetical protein
MGDLHIVGESLDVGTPFKCGSVSILNLITALSKDQMNGFFVEEIATV